MIVTIFLVGCENRGLSYEVSTLAECLNVADKFGVDRIYKIIVSALQPTEKDTHLAGKEVTLDF